MGFQYVALALALLGLAVFVAGVRKLRHRHVVGGCARCAGALVPMALAAAFALVASNLHTYARLSTEQPVAVLSFEQAGARQYRAVIVTDRGREAAFDLSGDEWQLDARVLKWHPWANLAGLDALYRLERLSGRYHNVDEELSEPRTVVPLSSERGLDLWGLANRHPRWIPLVDARYGSATYLPMADGARFQVRVTQSGLVARPDNDPARAAVREW